MHHRIEAFWPLVIHDMDLTYSGNNKRCVRILQILPHVAMLEGGPQGTAVVSRYPRPGGRFPRHVHDQDDDEEETESESTQLQGQQLHADQCVISNVLRGRYISWLSRSAISSWISHTSVCVHGSVKVH